MSSPPTFQECHPEAWCSAKDLCAKLQTSMLLRRHFGQGFSPKNQYGALEMTGIAGGPSPKRGAQDDSRKRPVVCATLHSSTTADGTDVIPPLVPQWD